MTTGHSLVCRSCTSLCALCPHITNVSGREGRGRGEREKKGERLKEEGGREGGRERGREGVENQICMLSTEGLVKFAKGLTLGNNIGHPTLVITPQHAT